MVYVSTKSPFKFNGNLKDLDSLFKEVENFDIVAPVENISETIIYSFNVLGAFCNYLTERNLTENMARRCEILKRTLDLKYQEQVKRIEAIEKNEIVKIQELLKLHKKDIEKNTLEFKKSISSLQTKFKNKKEQIKKKEEEYRKIRINLNKYIQLLKELIDTLKDSYDIKNEKSRGDYNDLCDKLVEAQNEYNKFIQ